MYCSRCGLLVIQLRSAVISGEFICSCCQRI
uniref:Uncharacterized protein n=1 Tax=Parascaris equorum TaxID=6256 RepID=A0A914RT43_PAREQ